MTHPMLEWLNAQLDADEALARAAELEAPSPWRTDGGTVSHGGPVKDYEKGDQLWDSEGCSDYWQRLCMTENVVELVAQHDPATVVADIAAKRAILDQHRFYLDGGAREQLCQTCGGEGVMNVVSWPCNTVRLLASAYAHRDGFDPAWAVLEEVDLW